VAAQRTSGLYAQATGAILLVFTLAIHLFSFYSISNIQINNNFQMYTHLIITIVITIFSILYPSFSHKIPKSRFPFQHQQTHKLWPPTPHNLKNLPSPRTKQRRRRHSPALNRLRPTPPALPLPVTRPLLLLSRRLPGPSAPRPRNGNNTVLHGSFDHEYFTDSKALACNS
jgi:hypothetical protein